jgi:ABC-2 type transport system permease protein
MPAILAIAIKDLRILFRVKSGLFFAFAWPLVISILFGAIFSGSSDGGTRRMAIALADDDRSAASEAFAARIAASPNFLVQTAGRSGAIDQVRKGRLAAALILPQGFGAASEQLFHGNPPQVEVWIDPSHQAEAAMIQGLLFQTTMEGFQKTMSDSGAMRASLHKSLDQVKTSDLPPDRRAALARFLGSMDRAMAEMPAVSSAGGDGASSNWQPLKIDQHDVAIRKEGPRNPFEITFPQGLLWGVLGCAMAFAIGFVSERTQGTLFRLQMAPIGRVHLVAGKALACTVACLFLEAVLLTIGRLGFHVIPNSWGLLVLAGVSTVAAFVGIMMLIAGLAKTEQAAGGVGWAAMMPLAMFGGAMVPLAFMPHWMAQIGVVSPVRWGILAFEGALWRGFSFEEMLLPCGILLAIGAGCFFIGTRTLRLS